MNDNGQMNDGPREATDRAWPGAVEYRSGAPRVTETLWRCDAMRAGILYQRVMFDTKAEAQEFVKRMQQREPDQMFSVEAIKASTIWN